jgi:hypothetical protein
MNTDDLFDSVLNQMALREEFRAALQPKPNDRIRLAEWVAPARASGGGMIDAYRWGQIKKRVTTGVVLDETGFRWTPDWFFIQSNGGSVHYVYWEWVEKIT